MLHEADLCPGCGHPMSESALHVYDVPSPSRCGACDAIQIASEKYEKSVRPGALRFGAVLKT